MRTRDKLVAAIAEYNKDGKHDKLAARAATGEFDDFADTHTCPITELHRLCRKYGLNELEESDEWAASPSGQAAFAMLSLDMRKRMKN